MSTQSIVIKSPIGPLKLTADESHLISVHFVEEAEHPETESDNVVLKHASEQIRQFFNRERKAFDLPLKIEGTAFQQEVWKALQAIPYGETRSYQQLAESIQRPKAVRAVGQANKVNRFPVIIPCHRVIGKNKTLTGYAGKQVDKKETLLQLEQ
ncbi:methylated-DNA--[protein]-cysteine S-methyltransferase [Bacillus sp. KH172YL63]|uniref:methylated-DNA--[protein]-cysteine S-methyltransferase n=1 Tax=Bacillus sp. KH172YL63 TaxID=2709784 RepID=UPI0013E4FC4E|nr:methylated-DNA--[protein]-cysteine S-methyltransferase [Bacillus sp. KH172YL63]BCB03128.1 methylated-DNA--protein-cysteine methyltransferase [Bacillus sp. KH172YL63]